MWYFLFFLFLKLINITKNIAVVVIVITRINERFIFSLSFEEVLFITFDKFIVNLISSLFIDIVISELIGLLSIKSKLYVYILSFLLVNKLNNFWLYANLISTDKFLTFAIIFKLKSFIDEFMFIVSLLFIDIPLYVNDEIGFLLNSITFDITKSKPLNSFTEKLIILFLASSLVNLY